MKGMTSRGKILLGCLSMVLAIVGDYLLGFGTFSLGGEGAGSLGITANVVPDWRYGASSVLGFLCVPLFALAALELMKVMEKKYRLQGQRLYQLFRIANWGGILYFSFIHIGLCMIPVVFNAGMEATGEVAISIGMALRVLKSIALPLVAGLVVCDVCGTVAWAGMALRGMLPVPKIALVCSPLVIALLGQLMNLLMEGLDSGFESLGWLLMYLVCAFSLVEKGERV